MSIRNENGSLLTETCLAIVLLVGFAKGALEVHHAFENRFHAILRHRNAGIERIRREAEAHPFRASLFSLPGDGGVDGERR